MLAMEKEGEGDGRLVEEREREECMEKTVWKTRLGRNSATVNTLQSTSSIWLLVSVGGLTTTGGPEKKNVTVYGSVLICIDLCLYVILLANGLD